MALGKNVKARREHLGLTQEQLAIAAGVTQVAIANLEKRDSKSSRNLTSLAKALSVEPSLLEAGTPYSMVTGLPAVHSVDIPTGSRPATTDDSYQDLINRLKAQPLKIRQRIVKALVDSLVE